LSKYGYKNTNTLKWVISAQENLNNCSSIPEKCSPNQAWTHFKKKIYIKKKKSSLVISANKFSTLWKDVFLHSLYFKKGHKKVLVKTGDQNYFKMRYKNSYTQKHNIVNYTYLKLNKAKIKEYKNKINAKKVY
jgi:hypothetical protein